MRHSSWQYLIGWTSLMARTYGGIVYDKGGKQWDWGQALCREIHGPDWNTSEDFAKICAIPEWEPVPSDILLRARTWATGNWPSWVDRDRENSNV